MALPMQAGNGIEFSARMRPTNRSPGFPWSWPSATNPEESWPGVPPEEWWPSTLQTVGHRQLNWNNGLGGSEMLILQNCRRISTCRKIVECWKLRKR